MSDKNPVYAAIAAMQEEPLICIKDRRNASLNSGYANLADVWVLLRPLLKKHLLGISFQFGRLRAEGSQYVLELTMVVYHTETGQFVKSSGEFPLPEGNRGVNFAQRFGSAKTYAERYALTSFFGVVTGDDDDAVKASNPPAPPAPGEAAAPVQWQDYLEDRWKEMPAPGPGSQLCGELSVQARKELTMAYPDHPALCAALADGIDGHIAKRGHTWESACAHIGGAWPELLDMVPNDLHAFAEKVRELPEQGGGL